jgi:hypothetical protein
MGRIIRTTRFAPSPPGLTHTHTQINIVSAESERTRLKGWKETGRERQPAVHLGVIYKPSLGSASASVLIRSIPRALHPGRRRSQLQVAAMAAADKSTGMFLPGPGPAAKYREIYRPRRGEPRAFSAARGISSLVWGCL